MTTRQTTPKHSVRWLLLGSLLFGAIWGARTLSAQYPTGLQITKDGTAMMLQDYASLPLSSVTSSTYPPSINLTGQLARVNFMRSEPTGAAGSPFRFFVSDSNRYLYILSKAAKTFTPYLNFEEIFPRFDNTPGLSAGLVTFAFAPDYKTSGTFYTVHLEDPNKSASAVPTSASVPGLDLSGGYTPTAAVNPPAGTVVRQAVLVEWVDTNNSDATFQGTAREILRVGFAGNIHPLGDLIFNPLAQYGDPDYGNLYIAVGDGASGETAGATHTIPQRLDALQGKILRITPNLTLRPDDEGSANGRYRIPTNASDPNPFVSLSLANLKKEIYAYGFRNPHRMTWDTGSNKLIVNDIGLNAWEEVDIVIKGGNYGYAEREGPEQLFVGTGTGSQTSPPTPFPSPDTLTVAGLAAPVTPIYPAMSYSHQEGDAMSAGFVYRGSRIPQLAGRYIFGDITTGRVFHSSLASMIASTRTSPAPINEVQIVYNSPHNNLGLVNRRMYDIVADGYKAKGGDSNTSSSQGVLPGRETVVGGFLGSTFVQGHLDIDLVRYGGGRADIRVVEGGDGEIYILSKSDGMIRTAFSVPEPAPEAPTIVGHPQNVAATIGGSASFTVNATGTAPLAYEWRKGGFTIPGATTSTLTLNNVQLSDSGSYDVVVTNSVSSATSNAATLVVNALPPVPAPTGLTATPGNAQVVLAWTAVGGATGYNVKRSTTNGSQYATVAANVTATTYTNTGLANGTTYYYVVSALMSGSESVNSSQAFATPAAPAGGALPSPWQTRDIGAVAATGNATWANGTFSVTGSGEDIYGTLDEFRFVYQPASGDCEIKLRVFSVQNSDPWAEAGVMIRETLNSNSKKVASLVTFSNGVTFQRRSSTGGSTYYSRTTGVAAPYFVRLVRSGNTFTAYRSATGTATTWTSMGSITVTMGTNVFIGLAVTAHRDGALNTSIIDSVIVVP